MYDKYGLIDSMIVALDTLTVTGAGNMRTVLDVIGRLSALKEGLKKEEQRAADAERGRKDDGENQQGKDL